MQRGHEAMLTLIKTRNNLTRRASWLIVLCGIAAILPASTTAQRAAGTASQLDVSVDYSYVRARSASGLSSSNLQGGSASVAFNFRGHLGIVGDFGGYMFGGQPPGLSAQMYTYLLGPRFTFRKNERFTPYAQALLGGGRLNASAAAVQAGENGFAMALGGGLDIALSQRFAIRAVQAEYLMTRFPNSAGNAAMENNFRVSAGLVFRLGVR
jgi:opacity protein-like surface antigen